MDLEVDRQHLSTVRIVDAASAALQPGEARLRVRRFALTANNITYAVFGDMMQYWNFFPAGPADDGVNWGRVPVWGFADVEAPTLGALAEYIRDYGYLPMSHKLRGHAGRLDDRVFVDIAAHLGAMAAALNGPAAEGKDLKVNLVISDTQQSFVLWIENAVLHHRQAAPAPDANVTISMKKDTFIRMITSTADIKDTLFSSDVKITGSRIDLVRFFSLFDKPPAMFSIVTP